MFILVILFFAIAGFLLDLTTSTFPLFTIIFIVIGILLIARTYSGVVETALDLEDLIDFDD